MPVTLAIIGGSVAVGAGVGNYFAGRSAADAQKSIAEQQLAMAWEILNRQSKDRETAVGMSTPSPQEMAQISKQLNMSMQSLNSQLASIAKDEELLHAVDPALKQAGVQAYQLLKGEEAAALAPIRAERARQRQSLESSLRDQLGSGYATSTAGIQALNQFDQDTAGTLQNAQQQTLQSFLGLSASIRPDVSGKLGRAFGGASQIGAVGLAGLQNVAGRKVAAFTGSPISYQNLLGTAGADQVGNLANAQALGNLFGNLGQAGGALAGAGISQMQLNQVLASNKPVAVNTGTSGASGIPMSGGYNGGAPPNSWAYNPVTGAPMFGGR